ncbi:universal stress protein [Aequorivita marina]|uniref:universal stress protein n=1 Tax=Aequorivita marina TaxID=3073654 RepID=UPI002876A0B7|nr:universal stress protein [Aequorivita sp. S2608]MDS1298680.1 universal stress protein [Aequorivita sp. S2608]
MRNILLPTDFSENAKHAIKYAMQFFKGQTCTFHLLNSQIPSSYMTADVFTGTGADSIHDGILSDNKKELEKLIEFCKSLAPNEDFSFVSKVDFANIIDAINHTVSDHNIELIVMGTKGATGAASVVFGSNTVKAVRNAKCPVLAIPENYGFKDINSVLLSLNYQHDITEENMKALLDTLINHSAALKVLETLEKGKSVKNLDGKRKATEAIFKDVNFERFSIKDLPAPVAVSAFEQLIPIDFHAVIDDEKKFLDRFIFGSDTTKISYASSVPLLILK